MDDLDSLGEAPVRSVPATNLPNEPA